VSWRRCADHVVSIRQILCISAKLGTSYETGQNTMHQKFSDSNTDFKNDWEKSFREFCKDSFSEFYFTTKKTDSLY
jgi:hypothetical protein